MHRVKARLEAPPPQPVKVSEAVVVEELKVKDKGAPPSDKIPPSGSDSQSQVPPTQSEGVIESDPNARVCPQCSNEEGYLDSDMVECKVCKQGFFAHKQCSVELPEDASEALGGWCCSDVCLEEAKKAVPPVEI